VPSIEPVAVSEFVDRAAARWAGSCVPATAAGVILILAGSRTDLLAWQVAA
jgi:hypothetical protein